MVAKNVKPTRWLKTPKGSIERKAHLFREGDRVSLCGRLRIPAAVTFDGMIEVRGGWFPVERCHFCWSLR